MYTFNKTIVERYKLKFTKYTLFVLSRVPHKIWYTLIWKVIDRKSLLHGTLKIATLQKPLSKLNYFSQTPLNICAKKVLVNIIRLLCIM